MQILLKRQGKPTSKYDVKETDSIGHLKTLLQNKDGVGANNYIIVFGGINLDDTKNDLTLASAGFKQGSIFHIAPKINGGI